MKLVRLFLISIFFSIISIPVIAQVERRGLLGIQLGISDSHIRDDHASPLFFRGAAFNPSLNYLYKSDKEIHFVELSFSYKNLNSNNPNFKTTNWQGKAKYGYLRSVSDFKFPGNQVKLYLGASASTFLCISDYHYLDLQHRSITSWYWNHSVNAELMLLNNLKKGGFISAQLSLPLISNISRPEFSASGNYDYVTNRFVVKPFGKTHFVSMNLFMDAVLTYMHPLGKRTNVQLNYEFIFAHYDKPATFSMYMNNFRAGLFFKI